MHNYVRRKTPTRLIIVLCMKWTCVLASVLLTLLLANLVSWHGQKRAYVRSASPQSPSTVDTVSEPLQPLKTLSYTPPQLEVPTVSEILLVAQAIAGEAPGLAYEEMRLVAWCICNRVDAGVWGQTVEEVMQFEQFYRVEAPSEKALEVAAEVLLEWYRGECADTLSPYAENTNYLYFYGDGRHNWYRDEY